MNIKKNIEDLRNDLVAKAMERVLGKPNKEYDQAYNNFVPKILSLIRSVGSEIIPKKREATIEVVDGNIGYKKHTPKDYGFNCAIEQMEAKLKEIVG